MPVMETINSNTDPVPNTDLPNPENSLNQENISLYGHLLLAALSDGENIKRALNPAEKFDTGTLEVMRGKRLTTTEIERKYNPIINGLSAHERTEKWKDKSFQDAYSQWSENLLSSIRSSETEEKKQFLTKFIDKDISEIKEEDIKTLYDRYCRNGSNVDDFVKKATESESNSTEVEWLAKKLFGTKSGETVKKIYEIEADIKKAGNIDNAIRKANEMFWQSGLDRFNNPNKEEEEILKLLFGNFRQAQEKTDEDNEGAPPAPATEESNETPAIIATPTDEAAAKSEDAVQNVDSAEEQSEKTDEEYNGAPPPAEEVEKATLDESPNPITEVEPTEIPEPTAQAETIEAVEPEKPEQPPVIEPSTNTPEPPAINQPETVEPNPISTGTSWPPAEVEPVNNAATSLIQKIMGVFKKK